MDQTPKLIIMARGSGPLVACNKLSHLIRLVRQYRYEGQVIFDRSC
jgi:hypothetical protein